MSLGLIILVYVAAIVILILEVFVPSGGILAVAGVIGLLTSIYYGFALHTLLGVILILATIIVVPLLFFYGIKKMTLDKKLTGQEGFRSEKLGLEHLLGKEGVTITNLRPSGTVLIDGKRVDVVTNGELIDKNTPVKVVKIEGTRVVVKTISEGGIRNA